jgi:hypothetical protein
VQGLNIPGVNINQEILCFEREVWCGCGSHLNTCIFSCLAKLNYRSIFSHLSPKALKAPAIPQPECRVL